MSQQSLPKNKLKAEDQARLEQAVDNLLYVARKSNFALFPTDSADLKPFLLSLVKDAIDVLIHDYIKEDLERAKFYGLVQEVEDVRD